MPVLTFIADGLGAGLLVLLFPVLILAVGIPLAALARLVLGTLGGL